MSSEATPAFSPAAAYHFSFRETLAALPPRMMPTADQIKVLRGFPTGSLASLEETFDFDYEERSVPGPQGASPVVVSIFSPKPRPAKAPTIYNVHGGGMVMGDRFAGIELVLPWIERFGLVIVSVEYRVAPENPHPAPVEDCYAGLVWLAEHTAELGLDPERLVLYGASAGGGLAAALALMARDRGHPTLRAQILDSPMIDDRNRTVSSHQIDNRGVWDRVTNEVAWSALLGPDHHTANVSPYAAAARATDVSNLPATYISAAAGEVFRDESVDYASRIWAAGGSAELHVWEGAFHGYSHMVADSPISKAAVQTMTDWLGRLLR